MLQHIVDKHGFRSEVNVIDTKVYDTEIDYIVLKKLVDLAVSKENKYKQYIKVTNFDLHKQLEYKLECKINNQKPRKVLENFDLLTRYKNQKQNCLGYDKHARRVYHINRQRLDEAVENTKYEKEKQIPNTR